MTQRREGEMKRSRSVVHRQGGFLEEVVPMGVISPQCGPRSQDWAPGCHV